MSEKEIHGIVAHVFEEQGLAPFTRKAAMLLSFAIGIFIGFTL